MGGHMTSGCAWFVTTGAKLCLRRVTRQAGSSMESTELDLSIIPNSHFLAIASADLYATCVFAACKLS